MLGDREIFVPAVGQYDNIGDVILRRQLLRWLRRAGRLNVYLGSCPRGYREALLLGADARVYKSFAMWYVDLVYAAAKGRADYVFKPGEIQMSLPGMKEHVGMLPALCLVKLRGGRVVRAGVGTRDWRRVPRLLLLPSVALSDMSAWRDPLTHEMVGKGEIMPDLAFGEGATSEFLRLPVDDGNPRNIVVSLRADRAFPSQLWLAAVRRLAVKYDAGITVATQVRRDNERSREVARALQGEHLSWETEEHEEQEARVRNLYRRAELVISDRLHVLVAAMTEGAAVAGALSGGPEKIHRHMAPAGLKNMAFNAEDLNTEQLFDRLEEQWGRRDECREAVIRARLHLSAIEDRVIGTLSGDCGRSRGRHDPSQ